LSDGLSNFLGPHEGRELELMASETKPLAMFVEPLPTEHEFFDEAEFDALVEQRVLVKKVRVESITTPEGAKGQIRRVLYAQASQAWRISAMLFVQDTYNSLGPGFHPDLERIIGLLLGYDRDLIEKYIASMTGNTMQTSAMGSDPVGG
jgi:hypothetical protein